VGPKLWKVKGKSLRGVKFNKRSSEGTEDVKGEDQNERPITSMIPVTTPKSKEERQSLKTVRI